jgi:hypothetical protein
MNAPAPFTQESLKAALLDHVPTDPFTAVHFCPTCRTAYNSAGAANACMKTRPIEQQTRFRPGDMVVIGEGYTWSDNADWIAEPMKGLHDRKAHAFFFIVTAITNETDIRRGVPFHDNRHLHRAIIHVATGGANIASDGELKDFRAGWTPEKGHRPMKKAENAPAALRKAAAHLIGMTTRHLL